MPDAGFDPSTIGIVGAGTMGRGIGSAFLRDGRRVRIYDIDESQLDRAKEAIKSTFELFVEYDRLDATAANDALERATFTTELTEAVSDADLVVEAVAEDMEIKQDVFSNVEAHAPPETVLASNTSGLSITEIASVTTRPDRVLGMHWFNPAYIVPLVEVVKADQTPDKLANEVARFLEKAGKTAVIVERDIPGYIGNRIQFAMCYEAFSLLDRGVASAEDIDRAVKAGFGFRLPAMGIFEKVDQSGLDIHHAAESYLMEDLDRGTEPNPTVRGLIEEGHLGLKTGKGVYDWSNVDPATVEAERDEHLLQLLNVFEDDRASSLDR